MRTFTKTSGNLLGEAAGLRWLAEAEPHGGAAVARIRSVDEHRLVLDYVESAPPTVDRARRFGAALAQTHAAGAEWWGCAAPGWEGGDAFGQSRTPIVRDRDRAPESWGAFYGELRIRVFAERLRDRGAIDADEFAVFDQLAERLCAGEFDVPQPSLVRDAGFDVARCHGDMWSGNVLYDAGPTGATLIDPFAQGGHAETDLGTLAVFGFSHLDEVYRGYDAASPLADGWAERIDLHRLGIVIMHAHIFGGGYVGEALRLAKRYD
ncbi:fructosamine kinase family protein [Gulosibacter faecalis]|uniref:Fructosamine kinase family protein n=1 Tax=Gulosibacter faecalis TaxID=272240 RepID=A0ABW5UWF3_9MICO|nr:fructosamine kinase family protein [Gulosibacter faecalis]